MKVGESTAITIRGYIKNNRLGICYREVHLKIESYLSGVVDTKIRNTVDELTFLNLYIIRQKTYEKVNNKN